MNFEKQHIELLEAVLQLIKDYNSMYPVSLEVTTLEVMLMTTMQLATMYNSIQKELP